MSKLRKRTWKLCSSSSLVDASLGGKINLGYRAQLVAKLKCNRWRQDKASSLIPGHSLGSAEPRVKCNGEGALSAGLRDV